MSPQRFFDRLIGKINSMDKDNIQAYAMKLSREIGFLQAIFDTIHEGIIVIDRKLVIGYVNASARKMLGLPENVLDTKISKYMRGIDWVRIMEKDSSSWEMASRQEIEILYPKRRILLFYVMPNGDDNLTATIILHDITESRDKTTETIQSEKLHILSLLSAGVAHEIGNPLNSIHIHLQLLERRLKGDGGGDPESLELLGVARKEVERLDTIINQFLQAIRSVKPALVKTDLKQIIVETLNSMKNEIGDRRANVKCEWPDDLPLVNGDAGQLRQAFFNILRNSLQAMAMDGDIAITCTYDDDYIQAVFADAGKGISHEDLTKIFEPYHTTKTSGSGLGLMVVERIIREHGAEMRVESLPERGTAFIIRFPRQMRKMKLLTSGDVDGEIVHQQ